MAPLVLVVFLLFLRFANVYLIRSFRWRLALGRFVSALQAYANLRRDDLRRYGAIIGVDAALMMPVCVGIMCIDQWFVKFLVALGLREATARAVHLSKEE